MIFENSLGGHKETSHNLWDLIGCQGLINPATGDLNTYYVQSSLKEMSTKLDPDRMVDCIINYRPNKEASLRRMRKGFCDKTITQDYEYLISSGASTWIKSYKYGSTVVLEGDFSQAALYGYGAAQAAIAANDCEVVSTSSKGIFVSNGDDTRVISHGRVNTRVKVLLCGLRAKAFVEAGESEIVSSGAYAKIDSEGSFTRIVSSGKCSQIVANGDNSLVTVTGKSSIVTNLGERGAVRACAGTYVTLAEYGYQPNYQCVVTKLVGEDGIKPNTWYTLKNGVFTEIKDIEEEYSKPKCFSL